MNQEVTLLLQKFLQGKTTADEEKQLRSLYDRQKITQESLQEYYDQQWELANQNAEVDAQLLKEKIRYLKKIVKQENYSTSHVLVFRNRWIKASVAAVIALVLTIAGIQINSSYTRSAAVVTISVRNGQKADASLPDGTVVKLNSSSSISYKSDFGKKTRTVKLIGEAYFEVAENKRKPFIVNVHDNLNIEALGTKFNVKSYPGDKTINSSLIEGRIKVSDKNWIEILSPNEMIVYNRQNKSFDKQNFENSDDVLFWLNNQLFLKNETLGEIAKTVERLYDVKVVFDSPDLQHLRYTGSIRNNSLDNILQLIAAVSPVEYRIENSVITFIKSNKQQKN